MSQFSGGRVCTSFAFPPTAAETTLPETGLTEGATTSAGGFVSIAIVSESGRERCSAK